MTHLTLTPLDSGPFLWRSFGEPFYRAPEAGDGARIEPQRRDRILIIEDDLLIATEMEAALADAGFEVIGMLPRQAKRQS
jgi:hypothetical protein